VFEGFRTEIVDVEGVGILVRTADEVPPLLLLHGSPQTHVMWHLVAGRKCGRQRRRRCQE